MTQITTRRSRTREKLLQAARSVFAERGIQAASVEEICERAGFTRGAFYSNFASKNDLVLAFLHQSGEVVLAGARHTLDTITPQIAEAGDVSAMLAEAVKIFVDTQDAELDGILAMHEVRLHAARVPELRGAYLEAELASRAEFIDMIGLALDELGWEWSMDPDLALAQLHGVYLYNALHAVITERPTREVIGPMIGALLSAMIRPQHG